MARVDVDVVVVGGGVMGMAAAASGARRGLRVAVVERFGLGNDAGASGGESRQWRLQYSERDIAELTLETLGLWRELERRSGRDLLRTAGSIWFGELDASTNEGHIGETFSVMDDLGIAYEPLDRAAIEARFPFRDLPSHYAGFFQPDGGVIAARATQEAFHAEAAAGGATFHEHEVVQGVGEQDGRFQVETSTATYAADHVVLAPGGFAADLLAPFGVTVDVALFEMATMTFPARGAALDVPTWFVFQEPTPTSPNLFYGFPDTGGAIAGHVRIAPDFERDPLPSAHEAQGAPRSEDVEETVAWVRRHMVGVDPEPVGPTTCVACLPTDPSRQFYLGLLPDLGASAGNAVLSVGGWGYKFAPLFGEVLIDLCVDGKTGWPVDRFGLRP